MVLEYINKLGAVVEHDQADPFGLDKPKCCGYVNCKEVAEPGYGRCAKHLKLDEELKNANKQN